MIVRDDSERGISPLTASQPSTAQADAPVSRGRMVQIPGWIIPLYAGLFIALGWFGGEQWRHPSPPQTLPLPVAHAALLPLTAAGETAPKNPPSAVKPSAPAAPVMDSDTLPPLRYSAHVYASLPEKRSIVLNGKAWSEGDSPLPNLVVEQIQQDVTIFSFNGTTFTLAALDDWPGGKIDEEPKGE
ncbi:MULTISPECIES: type II secretion system assembly factor GspB [Klebsiella]|uniref:Pullulanase-specific type II secretion system component B n=3 Tax=Klebsiella pneumoniae complex TaxID=3390273 RepID=A0A486VTX7_KLEPN|nr:MULTISPECIES: type II secretion system assembly factor GspB [Klebsiella]VGM54191.1 pullulanase-specific type II secretion system component B [Klebsiella pneumoniae]EKZ9767093.1 type II secretion system assembly factor GspB [Klebsiella variicola]ESM75806.1 general secretion pathway protein B [Klebsiella variicola]MBK2547758.1 general secretion pathway protein GspB [Klebsiella variicola]MBS0886711.1 type II secretion system assembly factor GspB [Klebsiella variicola]